MSIYRGVGGANEATDLATNQAVIAKSYAEQAAQSATEVNQTYNEFLDIYLGDFSSNPITDNQGDSLQVGALYFNTTDKLLRVYDGTNWLVSAVSEPSSFTRNTFSGTGSQTVFTLSTTPVNNDSVFVFISGVLTSAYNVVGTTLTFTSAPASGTNNILAIVASTVSTLAPADNSVSTVKLQEGAVTTSKLGDLQVTTAKIADSQIITSKVADANITLAKLASNSVDSSKIIDGSVGSGEIATNAIITSKVADSNITTSKLADSAVTTAKIAVNAVTGAKLGADIFATTTTATPETDDYLIISDTSNSGNTKRVTVADVLQLSAVNSEIRVNTPNSFGSTNTGRRRFSNLVVSQGTDISYLDSSTLGAQFTINTAGMYSMSYSDAFSGAADMGIAKNNTSIGVPATLNQILVEASTASSAYRANVATTEWLVPGDVISCYASGGGNSRAFFTIAKVG